MARIQRKKNRPAEIFAANQNKPSGKNPTGDNQPPTYQDRLVATCGTKKLTLLEAETEGGNLTVTVHAQATRVLVVQAMHVGREGENSDSVDAVVLDPAACAPTGF